MSDLHAKCDAARRAARRNHPEEFYAGVRAGFTADPLYPATFHLWSTDQRNAWFAGFNLGRIHRLLHEQEIE